MSRDKTKLISIVYIKMKLIFHKYIVMQQIDSFFAWNNGKFILNYNINIFCFIKRFLELIFEQCSIMKIIMSLLNNDGPIVPLFIVCFILS